MTKSETVKNLPGAKPPLQAVKSIAELQDDLSQLRQQLEQIRQLPEQAAQLALAIQPLADALHSILPTLESMDQRLKNIESVLPRNTEKKLRTLAAQGDLVKVYQKLESMSQPNALQKLLGQQSKKT